MFGDQAHQDQPIDDEKQRDPVEGSANKGENGDRSNGGKPFDRDRSK